MFQAGFPVSKRLLNFVYKVSGCHCQFTVSYP